MLQFELLMMVDVYFVGINKWIHKPISWSNDITHSVTQQDGDYELHLFYLAVVYVISSLVTVLKCVEYVNHISFGPLNGQGKLMCKFFSSSVWVCVVPATHYGCVKVDVNIFTVECDSCLSIGKEVGAITSW